MPWSTLIDYVCPKCGEPFQSTHWECPERCPKCRKEHRAKRSLINYYKRKEEGRSYSKVRDTAYDGVRIGPDPSVYSPTCIIHLRREVAACRCCGRVTDIINGYCDVCRVNGANEAQCHDASGIA